MFINMKDNDEFGFNVPLSGYKVAYFRVPKWESQENGLINGNPPTLEICLSPDDSDVGSFRNPTPQNKNEVAFKIPPNSVIIKVKAGEPWPSIDKIKKAFEERDNNLREAEAEAKAEAIEEQKELMLLGLEGLADIE